MKLKDFIEKYREVIDAEICDGCDLELIEKKMGYEFRINYSEVGIYLDQNEEVNSLEHLAELIKQPLENEIDIIQGTISSLNYVE